MQDSRLKKAQNRNIVRLRQYLASRKKQLNKVEKELKRHQNIYLWFRQHDWFGKVLKQIAIWEKNQKVRDITVPEYELFRYFIDDSVFPRFLAAFNAIERIVISDKSRYDKWNGTKKLLFSKNTSQIYAALFEILILGKLIASNKKVEPYHQNIDGRIEIDRRYIYFEIKSLQKSAHDPSGVGAISTQHDERQIFRALRGKARQLYHYRGQPTLVFLSLYRLADMVTGEWYVKDFLGTKEGLIVSAVDIYRWFTAGKDKKLIYNEKARNPLTAKERGYFISQY